MSSKEKKVTKGSIREFYSRIKDGNVSNEEFANISYTFDGTWHVLKTHLNKVSIHNSRIKEKGEDYFLGLVMSLTEHYWYSPERMFRNYGFKDTKTN